MYDFLIIGQGIAGSILAWQLIKAGKKVFIIDDSPPTFFSKTANKIVTSSEKGTLLKYADFIYPKLKSFLPEQYSPKVIGGLISPITGKRFVKTWLADTLLPFAANFYTHLERELATSFYKPIPIVRLFADVQQANDLSVRQADEEYDNYFKNYTFSNAQINVEHGYTVLNHGAVVDGIEMLSALHEYFHKKGIIKNILFNSSELMIKKQYIEWENIRTKALVFCEGWKTINNPYFNDLPFMPAKGELLVIKSVKLKLKELINRGIFIRPLNNDLYLVGSTYTWNDLSLKTTQSARNEMEGKLKSVIKSDYIIIEQLAGIRPSVRGRRPFLGKKQHRENIYIFNGLGTKGLLLAPFFSDHLVKYLLDGQVLMPEIDIGRFEN